VIGFVAITLGLRLAVKLALLVVSAACAVWAVFNAKRLRAIVRDYFQEEGSPYDLALFRVVLFATLFLTADPALIERYAGLPHELAAAPVGFAATLRILPPDPALARALTHALRIACVLAAIGLFTRSAAAIAGLLAFYVIGITQIYGQVDHYHFLVWFPLLLSLSPCGDALSLDAAWRRRRGKTAPASSVEYARPIRWVWLLMGVMYFFPGIWKLWVSGPDWLFGDALVSHMRRKWVELHWVPALRPDHYRGLMRAAGIGAIAFEISFLPLVLFHRARPIVAVVGLTFHNLSTLLMGISFIRLQAMYASFLRVERFLPRRLTRRASDADAPPASPGSTWPLDAVGGLWLSACVVMGALRIERAWPVACFPTFAFVARPIATELEFVAVSESGESESIDAWPIIRSLGTERWGPMARRAEATTATLSALARWVALQAPESRNAARIAVYRVAWSTNPDRRSEPERRELLAVVPRTQ
jgi:vitamin K-dependent gamma-carboxylase-like protein